MLFCFLFPPPPPPRVIKIVENKIIGMEKVWKACLLWYSVYIVASQNCLLTHFKLMCMQHITCLCLCVCVRALHMCENWRMESGWKLYGFELFKTYSVALIKKRSIKILKPICQIRRGTWIVCALRSRAHQFFHVYINRWLLNFYA